MQLTTTQSVFVGLVVVVFLYLMNSISSAVTKKTKLETYQLIKSEGNGSTLGGLPMSLFFNQI